MTLLLNRVFFYCIRASEIVAVIRIFLLALIVSVVCGCDGAAFVDGHVVDGEGNPIIDARVELKKENFEFPETLSEEDGAFHVGGICPPDDTPLDLYVIKEGYRDDHRNLPHGEHTIRVVMERLPSKDSP